MNVRNLLILPIFFLALSAAVFSSFSASPTDYSCPPVENLQATGQNNNILVTWDPVMGAIYYIVQILDLRTQEVQTYYTDDPYFLFFNLIPGPYQITVIPVCPHGEMGGDNDIIIDEIDFYPVGYALSACACSTYYAVSGTGDDDEFSFDWISPPESCTTKYRVQMLDESGDTLSSIEFSYLSATNEIELFLCDSLSPINPPREVSGTDQDYRAIDKWSNILYTISVDGSGCSLSWNSAYSVNVDYCIFCTPAVLGDSPELLQDIVSLQPNPTNEDVTLSYTLSEAAKVSWTIYHASGQMAVQPMAAQYLEMGTYQHQYDLSNLPPGSYYSMVKIGNKQKMLRLIKY